MLPWPRTAASSSNLQESRPLENCWVSSAADKGSRMPEKDYPVEEGGDCTIEDIPCTAPTGAETTPERLEKKLLQLEAMVMACGAERRRMARKITLIPHPEIISRQGSPNFTIGWNYSMTQEYGPKVDRTFIIYGVKKNMRVKMARQLESLGAVVSKLTGYDPSSTHLLCSKPTKHEMILCCMAAGKWILHTSYLEKSLQAGHFLNEDEYEFGNPKSAGKFGVQFSKLMERRMQWVHWWRLEVARRGCGAFSAIRAIVFAANSNPIIRVIEAGGGVVMDIKPPFDDTVDVTHCVLGLCKCEEYVPLARRGAYVVNIFYFRDYIFNPNIDIDDNIIPNSYY